MVGSNVRWIHVPSREMLTSAGCPDWHPWTGLEPINYIVYIIFAVRFATLLALSPQADCCRLCSP